MPFDKVIKVSKHATKAKGIAKQVATPIHKASKSTERNPPAGYVLCEGNPFEQPMARMSGAHGSGQPAALEQDEDIHSDDDAAFLRKFVRPPHSATNVAEHPVEIEVKLPSGEDLVSVTALASWTGAELHKEVAKFLKPELCLQGLLYDSSLLSKVETLLKYSSKGIVLNAVIGMSKPILHLFKPCSAQKLASGRRDNWIIGGYSDANLCCEGVQHQPMKEAPIVARKIARSIASEFDDLDTATVCGGDSSNMGGEIIVISNPGPDTKKACLQALAIQDKVNDMEQEDMKSIHAQATLKDRSQRKYQQTCVDHMVKCAIEDEEHGLQRIFELNFTENIVCAPVVYGGYASDGSIVGVLSSRVWT